MKRIIMMFLIFFSMLCSAQLPERVKCVEFASEPADTMILINKPDLDKINTAFYRLDIADSLNVINDMLVSSLISESNTLKELSNTQRAIIENQKIQIERIDAANKDVISDLEKQVKRANAQKTF